MKIEQQLHNAQTCNIRVFQKAELISTNCERKIDRKEVNRHSTVTEVFLSTLNSLILSNLFCLIQGSDSLQTLLSSLHLFEIETVH